MNRRLRPIPEPDDNDQPGGMPVLDLHGYNKSAAIRRLTDFLDMHSTGDSDKSYVKIITGAGSHSGPEGPVLRTSIKKLLERRQMEFNQETPGAFVVNAASGNVLFSEGQRVDSKVVVIGREFGNGGLDDNGSNVSEGIIRDTGQSSSLAGPLSASEVPLAACARAAPASPGVPLRNPLHHRHRHPGAAMPPSNSRGYDHGNNDDGKVLVVQRQGSDRKMAAIPSTPPADAPGVSFSPSSAISHQQQQEQLLQRHHHHHHDHHHAHDNTEEGDREAKAAAMGLTSPDDLVERQNEEIRVLDQARYESMEEQRIRQEREAQEELAIKEALRASLELSKQAETEEEELLRKAMLLSQQEQEQRKQLEQEERERQEMEFKKALELSHEVAAPDTSREDEDEIVRRALELSEKEEEEKRRQKEEEAKKLESELDDALRISMKLQEEEAAKEQEMLRKAMEMSQNAQEEKKQYNEEDEEEMLRKAMEMSTLQEQERLEEEEAYKRILEQSEKQHARAEGVASAASVESEEEAFQRALKESMSDG